MPQISVIVPVYKAEIYLDKCISSILNQTVADLELILVDDGSPDNCPKMCDEWAKKDNRIKVIHQSNQGVARARNAGMDIAAGKYIVFCDSDDYVDENWCESMLLFATEKEDNLIFCGMILEYPFSQGEPNIIKHPSPQKKEYQQFEAIHLHAADFIGYDWNILYYSSIINKINLRFDSTLITEDLPFVMEYAKHVKTLVYTGFDNYHYIQPNIETRSRRFHINLFKKYQEKYLYVLDFIDTSCDEKYHKELKEKTADAYLYYFLHSLDNTFDKRNKNSLLSKIKQNNQIIHSDEFKHCINHASEQKKKAENPKYLRMLQKHNYFTIYIYKKIASIAKSIETIFKKT